MSGPLARNTNCGSLDRPVVESLHDFNIGYCGNAKTCDWPEVIGNIQSIFLNPS
jgi:hypothetical protein